MVHDRETAGVVLPILRRRDFSNEALGAVFAAVQNLFNRDAPIDRLTVIQELGSDAYAELLQAAIAIRVMPGNAEFYAAMLQERARLDRIREAASGVQFAGDLEETRKLVDSMNTELAARQQWRSVTLQEAFSKFCDRHSADRQPEFLDLGFSKLKQRLYLERGDFIVIAAEPSVGKTSLAAQMAFALGRKHRVGFFSMETSDEKLTDRMVAQQTGIPLGKMKSNLLTDEDWHIAMEAFGRLQNLPVEQINAAGMSVRDIQSYSLAKHYEVIFVDYLQMIAAANPKASRYEQVTQISMDLHTMAQQTGIAVIGLSQLSRPDKSKKKKDPPGMHDLRESGQIEQDADAVLLLYLQDPANYAGPRVLKIGKNKEGERADFVLDFDGNTQTFKESAGRVSIADIRRAGKRQQEPLSAQVKMEEIGEEDGELPF